MAWWVRNAIIFFYALTVYLSYSQIILLAGGYAPIGFILTPSDMPYAPPLSMVVIAPQFYGGEGWGVRLIPASVFGVNMYVPVVHYYYSDGGWWEYVPNSRARLGATPIETAINMATALLPPYTPATYSTATPPRFSVLFILPAWVYVPIMLYALKYKLYYRGRRVW